MIGISITKDHIHYIPQIFILYQKEKHSYTTMYDTAYTSSSSTSTSGSYYNPGRSKVIKKFPDWLVCQHSGRWIWLYTGLNLPPINDDKDGYNLDKLKINQDYVIQHEPVCDEPDVQDWPKHVYNGMQLAKLQIKPEYPLKVKRNDRVLYLNGQTGIVIGIDTYMGSQVFRVNLEFDGQHNPNGVGSQLTQNSKDGGFTSREKQNRSWTVIKVF